MTVWGAKTPRFPRMEWDVVNRKEGFPDGFGAEILTFSGVPGSLLIETDKNRREILRNHPELLRIQYFALADNLWKKCILKKKKGKQTSKQVEDSVL